MKKFILITSLILNVLFLLVLTSVLLVATGRYNEASNPNTAVWYQIQSYKKGNSQPYTQDQTLCTFAERRIADLHKTGLSHDTFYEATSNQLLKATTYNLLGENLAERSTFGDFVDQNNLLMRWLVSPKHRENLDNPKYTHSCLRCDKNYCVQLFAGY